MDAAEPGKIRVIERSCDAGLECDEERIETNVELSVAVVEARQQASGLIRCGSLALDGASSGEERWNPEKNIDYFVKSAFGRGGPRLFEPLRFG